MRRGLETGLQRNNGVTFQMFTERDLDDFHTATLEILERTGILVESDEACDIYRDGGCKVDPDTHIVRIPPHVFSDAVRHVRSSFRLGGLDPDKDVLIEIGRSTFLGFSEAPKVNDLETGENRRAKVADNAKICHIQEALENIDINMVACAPDDAPTETAILHGLAESLPHITKPFMIGLTTTYEVELGFKMAAAVVGGEDELREKAWMSAAACPVAPLVLPHSLTDPLIASCRVGIPFGPLSMGMAGASTPVTLAGTLLIENVEVMAGIVLMMLVNPGNPAWYATSTCSMDLRWGAGAVGTPETALYQAGTVALANYYGLPAWTAGY